MRFDYSYTPQLRRWGDITKPSLRWGHGSVITSKVYVDVITYQSVLTPRRFVESLLLNHVQKKPPYFQCSTSKTIGSVPGSIHRCHLTFRENLIVEIRQSYYRLYGIFQTNYQLRVATCIGIENCSGQKRLAGYKIAGIYETLKYLGSQPKLNLTTCWNRTSYKNVNIMNVNPALADGYQK